MLKERIVLKSIVIKHKDRYQPQEDNQVVLGELVLIMELVFKMPITLFYKVNMILKRQVLMIQNNHLNWVIKGKVQLHHKTVVLVQCNNK